MKAAVYSYRNGTFHSAPNNGNPEANKVQAVIIFADKELLAKEQLYTKLKKQYPMAHIALASTAGEIFETEVMEQSATVVVISFDDGLVDAASVSIVDYQDSYEAGRVLVNKFNKEGLKYLFVLSDGSRVNGSELVRGMNQVLEQRIPITGGLAGDGTRFESTLVGLNEEPTQGRILALAFYGNHIQIGHGSMGGWETFGPERTITRANHNQLFEIDGKSALELYKTYLGKYADDLPGSALLFPLSLRTSNDGETVVRTILSIDNDTGSMIFAGDVPEGSRIRFMKANFDRLIDAATEAANETLVQINKHQPQLALLISCVGRKVILNTRVDEEVEAVDEAFDGKTLLAGFYSYGELSPINPLSKCELHNQTMTITTISEMI